MVGGGYSHIATCILQHVKPLILKKRSGWMVLLLLKINSLSTSMLYSLVRVCACVCVVEINGWISTRSVVHTGALSMLRQAGRICSKLTGPSGRSINVARLLV